VVSLQSKDKLTAFMQFTVILTNMKGREFINKTVNYYFSDSSDSLFLQLHLERQCWFGFLVVGVFLFVCFYVGPFILSIYVPLA